MTTFTEQDIATLQGLTGLSADAQSLVNRAVIDAQMGIDKDNAPKEWRSATLTMLVQYEDAEGLGEQTLIVLMSPTDSDVKTVVDIEKAHNAREAQALFPDCVADVLRTLTPTEVEH
jgi:hypothetical protein